jgi:hypothetical protein
VHTYMVLFGYSSVYVVTEKNGPIHTQVSVREVTYIRGLQLC